MTQKNLETMKRLIQAIKNKNVKSLDMNETIKIITGADTESLLEFNNNFDFWEFFEDADYQDPIDYSIAECWERLAFTFKIDDDFLTFDATWDCLDCTDISCYLSKPEEVKHIQYVMKD